MTILNPKKCQHWTGPEFTRTKRVGNTVELMVRRDLACSQEYAAVLLAGGGKNTP